jgi:hypothetical protein
LTTGETKRELQEALVLKKKRQERIVWTKLYLAVIASEKRHGLPTEVLHFRTSSEMPILNFDVSHGINTALATIGPQVLTGLGIGRSNKAVPRLTVDTRFPPPMGLSFLDKTKPESTSGSFIQYRDFTKDNSLSETDNSAETANIEAESDSIHLGNEDMDTMIENLSKISTSENSRLDMSETEVAITTPGVSTPMPGVPTSRTRSPMDAPNRGRIFSLVRVCTCFELCTLSVIGYDT